MPLKALMGKRILVSTVVILLSILTKQAQAGLEASPTGQVIARYDDNITRVKNDKIGDYSTQILGGFALDLLEKTFNVHFDGQLGYQFFAKKRKFDNFSQYGTLQMLKEFSDNGKLRITDNYSHTNDPQAFQAVFNRPAGVFSTQHNYANVEYKRDLTKQFSLDLNYINDLYLNEFSSDTSLNQIMAGIDYWIDSANSIGPLYTYKRMDFNPGNSSTTNEVAVKLRHYLTKQLYADLVAGDDFINDFNGKNSQHPAFRASLTDDLDLTTQTVFSVSREYSTTPYSEELFSGWRFATTFNKELSERLNAYWDIFYATGKFIPTGTKDSFIGASLGLNYDLTKNAKLVLNYSFSHEQSDISENSYTRNIISAALRIEL